MSQLWASRRSDRGSLAEQHLHDDFLATRHTSGLCHCKPLLKILDRGVASTVECLKSNEGLDSVTMSFNIVLDKLLESFTDLLVRNEVANSLPHCIMYLSDCYIHGADWARNSRMRMISQDKLETSCLSRDAPRSAWSSKGSDVSMSVKQKFGKRT